MRTYQFKSKRTDTIYVVTVDGDYISCTCRGYSTPSKCWHVKEVASYTPVPVSPRDRYDILKLLQSGNDAGALQLANDLFPSMSLEETADLVNEISLDEVGEFGAVPFDE